jgi:hypothetical protein
VPRGKLKSATIDAAITAGLPQSFLVSNDQPAIKYSTVKAAIINSEAVGIGPVRARVRLGAYRIIRTDVITQTA